MEMNHSSETWLVHIPVNKGNIYVYLAALFLAAAFLISRANASGKSDAREPHILVSRVPLIGHLLGIIQHQAEYFQMLR